MNFAKRNDTIREALSKNNINENDQESENYDDIIDQLCSNNQMIEQIENDTDDGDDDDDNDSFDEFLAGFDTVKEV
jgi:hypothetical protein